MWATSKPFVAKVVSLMGNKDNSACLLQTEMFAKMHQGHCQQQRRCILRCDHQTIAQKATKILPNVVKRGRPPTALAQDLSWVL